MFIFLGLGGIKTSVNSQTFSQSETLSVLSNQTILFISVSMGLSLLITAWVFYRITGGLFNPAVTLALYLIGGLRTVRAILLTIAQCAGGIAGAGLVAVLTPAGAGGGIETTITKLSPGINIGQGLMLEAFLTAMLVFTVLMLAAESERTSHLSEDDRGLTFSRTQGYLYGSHRYWLDPIRLSTFRNSVDRVSRLMTLSSSSIEAPTQLRHEPCKSSWAFCHCYILPRLPLALLGGPSDWKLE